MSNATKTDKEARDKFRKITMEWRKRLNPDVIRNKDESKPAKTSRGLDLTQRG